MRGTRSPGVIAAVLVLGCGCSFVAVRRPPPSLPPPGAPLECTESRVAPLLDTAGAIATPLAGLVTWGLCAFVQSTQSWSSEPKNLRCGTVLLATLAGTAAYTWSAVYGFRGTGECRRAMAQGTLPQDAPGPVRPLPPNLAPRLPAETGGPDRR